jgi:hypothetical protein
MTAAPVVDRQPPFPVPAPTAPRRGDGAARSRITERGDQVVVELRAAPTPQAAAGLVTETFAHPAVRARRPVLVVVPRGDSDLIDAVHARVSGASSRVAGVTCLIEGRVNPARVAG